MHDLLIGFSIFPGEPFSFVVNYEKTHQKFIMNGLKNNYHEPNNIIDNICCDIHMPDRDLNVNIGFPAFAICNFTVLE